MVIVRNKLLPFKGFKAMALWPFIFIRSEYPFDEVDLNHEKIHGRQQIELALIFFYIIYFIEWLFKGYRNISFEREAYSNENNLDYLKHRKCFAQWKKPSIN